MLTAGKVHDIRGGRTLLANVAPMRRLITDKAYDDIVKANGFGRFAGNFWVVRICWSKQIF